MRPTPRHRVALAAALAMSAALAAATASAAPRVGAPLIAVPTAASAADGTVTVDVPVRWGTVRGTDLSRLERARATHDAQVTLSVAGRVAAGTRTALWTHTPGGRLRLVHRLRVRGDAAAALRRGPLPVLVEVSAALRLDGRGRPDLVRLARRGVRLQARQAAAAATPAALCQQSPLPANYARSSRLQVVCPGAAGAVRVTGAARGRVKALAGGGAGRAVVAYTPPRGFTGRDTLTVDTGGPTGTGAASQALATVPVAVAPFKLTALGDSVTAGYGFLSDGTPWGIADLPFCIPPSTLNNRCSSNSPNGVGSTNPVGWTPDFGLSNGVAWPAQFARGAGITTPGYANWAVTGSTPADWDTGGALSDVLAGIVGDDPDLVVMTLGANPLLDSFLKGKGIECAVTFSDAELVACVQGFIDGVGLVPHLSSVLAQLLQAPHARVVASTYHLAIPSVTVFSAHQIEVIFDTVDSVVAGVVRASPAFGSRLFLMGPPRFPVGRPPGTSICTGTTLSQPVDGPSRQSRATQDVLALDPFLPFCGSSDYWIISADTGIHPSVAGHAQFAAALSQVVAAEGLVPPLP